jgi:outer membrane murein-binding lipoprotein Lpp
VNHPATDFQIAAWLTRIVTFSIAAAVLSLGLSGCSAFCENIGSRDQVAVVADEAVTITEVCMLDRCVSEAEVNRFAPKTRTFYFAELARKAKQKSTSITVKYKRAEVPETLEVDVKPSIQIPAGEGCDPVEYHFGVVVP